MAILRFKVRYNQFVCRPVITHWIMLVQRLSLAVGVLWRTVLDPPLSYGEQLRLKRTMYVKMCKNRLMNHMIVEKCFVPIVMNFRANTMDQLWESTHIIQTIRTGTLSASTHMDRLIVNGLKISQRF